MSRLYGGAKFEENYRNKGWKKHRYLTPYGLIATKINRIWTIYDEEEMWNYCKFNPETGIEVDRNNIDSLKPFHHHGVFLEDKLHDWNVNKKENLLHYGSRVVEQGENIKILVEYEDK